MLKHDVERRGAFNHIPRYIRVQVTRRSCQIPTCGRGYGRVFCEAGNKIKHPRQVIHHLIPRRWLEEHGIFEHYPSGLLSICQYCHGRMKPAEDRLYQGDVIGFLTICKNAGLPVERIVKFALSIGIKEFGGLTI
jgi:hypothetical protein